MVGGKQVILGFAKDLKIKYILLVLSFYKPLQPVNMTKTPEWVGGRELDYEVLGAEGMAPRFAFYSGVK